MKLSLSFLASDLKQLPDKNIYGIDAVEAISFVRSDLDKQNWDKIWRNVKKAVDIYGPYNVTYHFPMNGSEYVDDKFVYSRLQETFKRASDIGLDGVVVHSNKILSSNEWIKLNMDEQRDRVCEKLSDVVNGQDPTRTWLGLENMPVIGNEGNDLDPMFCYSKDFSNLDEKVKVVWDVCHSTSTLGYLEAVKQGLLPKAAILNYQDVDLYDFQRLGERIAHWHFAAYKGLNIPQEELGYFDGMLPMNGSMPETVYTNILLQINKLSNSETIVNFEIQENDYYVRENGLKMINWAEATLSNI